MVRTQVQFTEEEVRGLKALAATRSVSVAEVVRNAVDEHLASSSRVTADERRRRAMAVAGTFRSGVSDLAEAHDRYLAEALES